MTLPLRKRRAGWFVEVDASLKSEFKSYYPGRSWMRKVTESAIRRAIKKALKHNLPRRKIED